MSYHGITFSLQFPQKMLLSNALFSHHQVGEIQCPVLQYCLGDASF